MCFRSAIPIIYPYLFEPIHHIHPACLSRKQKLWFHILIMVSLSWLQWVMVNMFQISHPYYSRAWEAFFSNTTLPLKLLTAAAIWETEGFSYSYIYSHCSWTEQKLTLIIQVGVTALPFLFLLLAFILFLLLLVMLVFFTNRFHKVSYSIVFTILCFLSFVVHHPPYMSILQTSLTSDMECMECFAWIIFWRVVADNKKLIDRYIDTYIKS